MSVKWASDDKVTIYYSRDWMGGGASNVNLVIKSDTVVRPNPHTFCVVPFPTLGVSLDAFLFESSLRSEWGQPLDIGLYCGNGANSTQEFQLVFYVNQIASRDIRDHHKVFDWISSLKLAPQTQEQFEQNIGKITWTEIE